MLKPALAIALIGFFAIAASWPVEAQTRAPAISQEQAAKVARDNGLVDIREMELDDGKWEIEGRNRDGKEWEIHVDATSGKVLRNERD